MGRPEIFTVNQPGYRLDHFLVNRLPAISRSALTRNISAGGVQVNGYTIIKAGHRLRPGDQVTVVPLEKNVSECVVPEPVFFEVLHEDDHVIVISKPPGVVVHPAAGHARGTLVHGLVYRFRDLAGLDAERPGIVHRLDKDTSGIMVVARTSESLRRLAADFKDRRVLKIYHALLVRCPSESVGRIVAPLGRHPVARKKMAIRYEHGRYAATRWKIVRRFSGGPCMVEIRIETGRTHQIRVHMASLGAPVAGDALYGGRRQQVCPVAVDRQMLHASTLCFSHPATGREMQFTAPIWPDFQEVLDQLH